MQVAGGTRIRNEFPALALRTRGRSHDHAACHAPGCRNRATRGRKFCKFCQSRLDRVRIELKSVGPRGRKPTIRRASATRKAA
jgi:hypothetical protein